MTDTSTQKKILAIIPARGGSKGLPGKNIMPLLDKPLLAWTIQQAQNCQQITDIFVSTDDQKIADVAIKCGVDVPILRPQQYAADNSPTIDVIFHVLDYYATIDKSFEVVVLLEPTSPLRKRDDLDSAISKYLKNSEISDSLVSVGEVHTENPFIVKKIENDAVKTLITSEDTYYQRQQLPKAYFPYGVIYLATVKSLKEMKTFYQDNTLPYFIERWQNYEIDDIYDYYCIEAIMKQKLKEII